MNLKNGKIKMTETKKYIIKVFETSSRTIEINYEMDIPIEITNSINKDDIIEYIYKKINENSQTRTQFVDIIESDTLESEIVDFKEGSLPETIQDSYTIKV